MTRALAFALALTGTCASASSGGFTSFASFTAAQAAAATGAGSAAPASAHAGAAQTPLPTPAPTPHAVCVLRLTEHRSGRELLSLPLDRQAPEIRIAFEHSVLGTTVVDRYRFTPTPLLVEEEFEGEGYGLPVAPGPGERMERVGTRTRLTLARAVVPLVVRALADPRMRLLLPQGELLLATLGAPAVALEALGCGPTPP